MRTRSGWRRSLSMCTPAPRTRRPRLRSPRPGRRPSAAKTARSETVLAPTRHRDTGTQASHLAVPDERMVSHDHGGLLATVRARLARRSQRAWQTPRPTGRTSACAGGSYPEPSVEPDPPRAPSSDSADTTFARHGPRLAATTRAHSTGTALDQWAGPFAVVVVDPDRVIRPPRTTTWCPMVCLRPGFRFQVVARAAVPAAAAARVALDGASTSSYSDANEPQDGIGEQR